MPERRRRSNPGWADPDLSAFASCEDFDPSSRWNSTTKVFLRTLPEFLTDCRPHIFRRSRSSWGRSMRSRRRDSPARTRSSSGGGRARSCTFPETDRLRETHFAMTTRTPLRTRNRRMKKTTKIKKPLFEVKVCGLMLYLSYRWNDRILVLFLL